MADHTTRIDAADTLSASQAAITSMQRNGLLGGFIAEKKDSGTFTQGDSCYGTQINAEDDFNVPGVEDALDTNFDELLGAFVFNESGAGSLAVDNIGYFIAQGPLQFNTSSFAVGDFLWNDTATHGTLSTTPVVGLPPVAKVLVDNATGLAKYNCDGIWRNGSFQWKAGIHIGALPDTASQDFFLMAGPYGNCRINQVYLISDTATTGSVAATTEWSFQIRNLTAANDLLASPLVTSTTEVTADTVYDLSPDQNQTIAANDVIELQVTRTGSPTSWASAVVGAFVEYQPI